MAPPTVKCANPMIAKWQQVLGGELHHYPTVDIVARYMSAAAKGNTTLSLDELKARDPALSFKGSGLDLINWDAPMAKERFDCLVGPGSHLSTAADKFRAQIAALDKNGDNALTFEEDKIATQDPAMQRGASGLWNIDELLQDNPPDDVKPVDAKTLPSFAELGGVVDMSNKTTSTGKVPLESQIEILTDTVALYEKYKPYVLWGGGALVLIVGVLAVYKVVQAVARIVVRRKLDSVVRGVEVLVGGRRETASVSRDRSEISKLNTRILELEADEHRLMKALLTDAYRTVEHEILPDSPKREQQVEKILKTWRDKVHAELIEWQVIAIQLEGAPLNPPAERERLIAQRTEFLERIAGLARRFGGDATELQEVLKEKEDLHVQRHQLNPRYLAAAMHRRFRAEDSDFQKGDLLLFRHGQAVTVELGSDPNNPYGYVFANPDPLKTQGAESFWVMARRQARIISNEDGRARLSGNPSLLTPPTVLHRPAASGAPGEFEFRDQVVPYDPNGAVGLQDGDVIRAGLKSFKYVMTVLVEKDQARPRFGKLVPLPDEDAYVMKIAPYEQAEMIYRNIYGDLPAGTIDEHEVPGLVDKALEGWNVGVGKGPKDAVEGALRYLARIDPRVVGSNDLRTLLHYLTLHEYYPAPLQASLWRQASALLAKKGVDLNGLSVRDSQLTPLPGENPFAHTDLSNDLAIQRAFRDVLLKQITAERKAAAVVGEKLSGKRENELAHREALLRNGRIAGRPGDRIASLRDLGGAEMATA